MGWGGKRVMVEDQRKGGVFGEGDGKGGEGGDSTV